MMTPTTLYYKATSVKSHSVVSKHLATAGCHGRLGGDATVFAGDLDGLNA